MTAGTSYLVPSGGRFTGKTAIETAASRGIGLVIAQRPVDDGDTVTGGTA